MDVTKRLPARFTLAHGLMILAGLLTFVLVNSALKDKSEMVDVVYAGERASVGSIDSVVRPVSASTPGIEKFANPADLEQKILIRTVEPGVPIMKGDLIESDRKSYRLFAIPVEQYQIEALELAPFDRVDVIGFDAEDNAIYVAIGLAVEGSSSGGADGLNAGRESYVTLQVTDQDALRMAVAQRHGDLSIVRNTGSAPLTVLSSTAFPGAGNESAEGGQP